MKTISLSKGKNRFGNLKVAIYICKYISSMRTLSILGRILVHNTGPRPPNPLDHPEPFHFETRSINASTSITLNVSQGSRFANSYQRWVCFSFSPMHVFLSPSSFTVSGAFLSLIEAHISPNLFLSSTLTIPFLPL